MLIHVLDLTSLHTRRVQNRFKGTVQDQDRIKVRCRVETGSNVPYGIQDIYGYGIRHNRTVGTV